MLRSPLQRLKNEHVECSLQQLNPVFILVFLVHRCRHSTPNGGRSSTSSCIAQRAAPLSRFKSTSVLRTTIGDSALALNRQCTHRTRLRTKSRLVESDFD